MDHGLVEGLEAHDGRDHDREISEQEGEKAFRREIIAEIKHQQRRQRDFRNGVERNQQGVDRALEETRIEDRESRQHARHSGNRKARDHLDHRHQRIRQQQTIVAADAQDDLPWRWQDELGESEERDGRLPDHQDQDREGGCRQQFEQRPRIVFLALFRLRLSHTSRLLGQQSVGVEGVGGLRIGDLARRLKQLKRVGHCLLLDPPARVAGRCQTYFMVILTCSSTIFASGAPDQIFIKACAAASGFAVAPLMPSLVARR